jgi:hypothetical protein
LIDDDASVQFIAEIVWCAGSMITAQDSRNFEKHGGAFVEILKRAGHDCVWGWLPAGISRSGLRQALIERIGRPLGTGDFSHFFG